MCSAIPTAVSKGFKLRREGRPACQMTGNEIYKVGASITWDNGHGDLERQQLPKSELDGLIPHQAEYSNIEAMRKARYSDGAGLIGPSITRAIIGRVRYPWLWKPDSRRSGEARPVWLLLEALGGGFTWVGNRRFIRMSADSMSMEASERCRAWVVVGAGWGWCGRCETFPLEPDRLLIGQPRQTVAEPRGETRCRTSRAESPGIRLRSLPPIPALDTVAGRRQTRRRVAEQTLAPDVSEPGSSSKPARWPPLYISPLEQTQASSTIPIHQGRQMDWKDARGRHENRPGKERSDLVPDQVVRKTRSKDGEVLAGRDTPGPAIRWRICATAGHTRGAPTSSTHEKNPGASACRSRHG